MAATAGHRLTLDPIGKCSNAFFSETTNMIKAKLYRNVHWMVLYKFYIFCSDMKFKMVATAGLSLTLDPMGNNDRCHLIANVNQRLSRACIVHLVIKKTNWSYVKTMSCSGSHLGITINIKNTKFVKCLPMIDAQFRFNQCNSFREEYISVFSPSGPVLIL
jgi:hypothetical protein